MQDSSIQHQHFWIELSLGVVMVVSLAINPLEKGIVAAIVLGIGILSSRTIHKGRIAANKLAAQRRARQEEMARRAEERRLKQEALRQAQLEAAQKYLD